MDELGFNKLAGAVLLTGLAFIGVRTVAEVVVPEHDFEALYVPEVQLETAGAEEEVVITVNSPEFVAALDATRGERVFRKCLSCHNAEPGGPNGTGPNLYAVMGKQMGTHAGFAYSSAMASKAAPWTWEEMNGFLTKPKDWLPGTAMNYIGLRNFEDRAAVMAYLNTRTDSPLPLPEAVAPAEEVEVADERVADAAAQPSEETRIIDDPQIEGIPGNEAGADTDLLQPDPEDLVADADDAGADDAGADDAGEGLDTLGDEQGVDSAGELTIEDANDPGVPDALDPDNMDEQLAPEETTIETEDDVLDFLNRRRAQ